MTSPFVIPAIVAGVASIVVAIIAARASNRSTVVQFNQDVLSRLRNVEADLKQERADREALEERLDEERDRRKALERDMQVQRATADRMLQAAIGYIETLAGWFRSGAEGSWPTPPEDLRAMIRFPKTPD